MKGIYRHYKNKQLYEVIDVVLDTEKSELMVLFRGLVYDRLRNPKRLNYVTTSTSRWLIQRA